MLVLQATAALSVLAIRLRDAGARRGGDALSAGRRARGQPGRGWLSPAARGGCGPPSARGHPRRGGGSAPSARSTVVSALATRPSVVAVDPHAAATAAGVRAGVARQHRAHSVAPTSPTAAGGDRVRHRAGSRRGARGRQQPLALSTARIASAERRADVVDEQSASSPRDECSCTTPSPRSASPSPLLSLVRRTARSALCRGPGDLAGASRRTVPATVAAQVLRSRPPPGGSMVPPRRRAGADVLAAADLGGPAQVALPRPGHTQHAAERQVGSTIPATAAIDKTMRGRGFCGL